MSLRHPTGMSLQKWMTLFKNKYRIESARLKGYDYSSPGEYFVTICAGGMVECFGDVVDGKMKRNDVGEIVAEEWQRTQEIREKIMLDEWVVMPNHFHGIICIVEKSLVETPRRGVSNKIRQSKMPDQLQTSQRDVCYGEIKTKFVGIYYQSI
jgi:REP element-mobilizing transposase RayT